MTAITTTHSVSATRFDRALLMASSYLDKVVSARMERRASTRPSRADVERVAVDARVTAQAMGATGMLPR